MKVQDYIIRSTTRSAEHAFAQAAKVAADKLDWKPLDEGRSVLDQCKELALCPLWAVEILAKGGFEMTEEAMAQYGESIAKLQTMEDCKLTLDENLKTMNAAISAFPEDRLSEEITLPWGTFNFAEVMAIPEWNFNYHLGQINYIQTLYGDKEM